MVARPLTEFRMRHKRPGETAQRGHSRDLPATGERNAKRYPLPSSGARL